MNPRLLICLALSSAGAGLAAPKITAVVNSASYTPKLARGSLATVFGTDFTGGVPASASAMPLPNSLAGVSVRVGGIAAPMLYVSGTQINFQVPYEVPAGSSADVVVTSSGSASASFSVAVADYAVGVFTYARTAQERDPVIVHGTTNALVTPSNPAQPNEIVVAYATGIGKLNSPPRTGAAASRVTTAVDPSTVMVGGVPGTVLFAGLTQGFAGLAQFNIRLPGTLNSGNQPLVITFPGDVSASVNLAVQGNTAGSPKLLLSMNTLGFGCVNVGQTRDMPLTLWNDGTAALTVQSVAVTGTGFTLVSAPGPFSVATGEAQTAIVRFAPAATGEQTGALAIASDDPANASVSIALKADGVAAGSVLGLFLSSMGGTSTDYIPEVPGGITIDYTSFLFSLVVPSAKKWFVLDKNVSPSYARFEVFLFEQDAQVYKIIATGYDPAWDSCELYKLDLATRKFGPRTILSSCTPSSFDHLGVVGNSIYYRVPVWQANPLGPYSGGEFKVKTGTTTTTLLSRTDRDNQAFMDAADHGTLYAIFYNPDSGAMQVWTRSLETGRLDRLVRSSTIQVGSYKVSSFRISDGVLYLAVTQRSDNAFQIWARDLSGPTATPTLLLATYPASSLSFMSRWNVDHGRVAFAYTSTTVKRGVAVLDAATRTTEYHDLGDKTQIYGLAPMWVPGP